MDRPACQAVTMNIYAHVIPVMQYEAAGRMDEALGGAEGPEAGECDER